MYPYDDILLVSHVPTECEILTVQPVSCMARQTNARGLHGVMWSAHGSQSGWLIRIRSIKADNNRAEKVHVSMRREDNSGIGTPKG